MPDALFDVEPAAHTEQPTLTTGQRRINRQAAALQHGQHPLAVALRIPIGLHRDAPTDRLDRDTPGTRCGTCRFRDPHNGGTASDFPKCWWRPDGAGRYPRITSGPGTDVRAWWPACTSYQPREASNADA